MQFYQMNTAIPINKKIILIFILVLDDYLIIIGRSLTQNILDSEVFVDRCRIDMLIDNLDPTLQLLKYIFCTMFI